MDNSIESFLKIRKEAWLKNENKQSLSEDEQMKIQQKATETFSLDSWLHNAARRASWLSLVSHPSKFSHPSAKSSTIIANQKSCPDGLLRSGNVAAELDTFGSASASDVIKFLALQLQDQRTILSHLENKTDYIKNEFAITTATFEELCAGFLSIRNKNERNFTSGTIKQVYFPVDDNYHLLSILTPSNILFELKKRIQSLRFSDDVKIAKEDKKHQRHNKQGFDELYGLTLISYGGTKPQNISVLNSKNGGKAYLLPSLPPSLEKRNIRLPKKDFFKETLWMNQYQISFKAYHNLLVTDINNINIRQGAAHCVYLILDQVMHDVWRIREFGAGWTATQNYTNLPLHQKIWLDNHHIIDRDISEEWLIKIVEEFARWFIHAYEKNIPEAKILRDDEMRYIKQLILVGKSKESLK